MITIAKRNIKLFFRDKTSVFFSLLAVFIIIGLYVLFLGDVMNQGLSEIPNPAFLINSWVMSGMIAVTSITTTMGAFGIMIEDREDKIMKDFYTSPIKRSSLTAGYIVSSFVIGVIMTLVTLVLSEIYIVSKGGELLELAAFAKVFGLILLSVLSNSALIFFMVSFFKGRNAFATASTVIGTLMGFLMGIYIPIGQLPESVQTVIKVFPPSHAASLMRRVMMEVPLGDLSSAMPQQYVDQFNLIFGVTFKFGDQIVTIGQSMLILAVTAVVFYGLSLINLSRKAR